MNFPFDVVDQSVKEHVKEKYFQESPSSIGEIIQYLKDKGVTQMPTVFLLVNELQIPFTKANEYVLNSKSWNG